MNCDLKYVQIGEALWRATCKRCNRSVVTPRTTGKFPCDMIPVAARPSIDFGSMIKPGVGRELYQILRRLGLHVCMRCVRLANLWSSWGPEKCRAKMPAIVAALRMQAKKRGIPFLAPAARILVKTAIRRVEKCSTAATSST